MIFSVEKKQSQATLDSSLNQTTNSIKQALSQKKTLVTTPGHIVYYSVGQ